jgi:hypothetical protein
MPRETRRGRPGVRGRERRPAPFVFGPGAIMDPAPGFPVGPGAAGRWEPNERASLSEVLGGLVNGQTLPTQGEPALPQPPARGFAPPAAPVDPAPPSAPLAVRPGRGALSAALSDMDALASEPWTERPEGFLPGLGWELRELLIRRQMERMRNKNAPGR